MALPTLGETVALLMAVALLLAFALPGYLSGGSFKQATAPCQQPAASGISDEFALTSDAHAGLAPAPLCAFTHTASVYPSVK